MGGAEGPLWVFEESNPGSSLLGPEGDERGLDPVELKEEDELGAVDVQGSVVFDVEPELAVVI